ncbi:MAG: hypothetical protein IPK31_06235 [Chitinophagaceae bacterium]|nr:hypothetical protein [Chitinophagaceae bacterium]
MNPGNLIFSIAALVVLNFVFSYNLIKRTIHILFLYKKGIRSTATVVDSIPHDEEDTLTSYDRIIEYSTVENEHKKLRLDRDALWIRPKTGKTIKIIYNSDKPEDIILVNDPVYYSFLLAGYFLLATLNIMLFQKIL